MHVCMCAHVCMNGCMLVCLSVCKYVCTYIQTYLGGGSAALPPFIMSLFGLGGVPGWGLGMAGRGRGGRGRAAWRLENSSCPGGGCGREREKSDMKEKGNVHLIVHTCFETARASPPHYQGQS